MNDLTLYNAVKDHMQTGDLLLWKSRSILGAAIQLFTASNVNHASLVMRFQEYEGGEGRRFTTEALEHGIVLNLLSRRLAEYDGEVFWYPLRESWNYQRPSIGEKALKYMGVGYDYKSLFRNAVTKVTADDSRLFCSEYCFLCYGMEGEAPTPGDMEALGIFQEPVRIL